VVQARGYLSILMMRKENNKDVYKYANRNNSYIRSFLRCLLEEGQESGGELECADMARKYP
jgi:hypothetical protein